MSFSGVYFSHHHHTVEGEDGDDRLTEITELGERFRALAVYCKESEEQGLRFNVKEWIPALGNYMNHLKTVTSACTCAIIPTCNLYL